MKLTEMGFKKEKTAYFVFFEKEILFCGNIAKMKITYHKTAKTINYQLRVNDQEIVWRVIGKDILDALYEEINEL